MNRVLDVGYKLKLSGKEFVIKNIVGKGASSVTYLAECNKTEHILKECNPLGIDMHRTETGELVADTDLSRQKFEECLERFNAGADKQLSFRLTEDLKNPTSNIQDIYHANRTAYIDMTYFGGKTYDKVDNETLYDLFRRMKALAQIVGHYHKLGYLHLDIKPQNIYTIPETPEMVMMFDFDSVTPINDINSIISSSYTDVWAAPEQKMPKYRNQICEATDLFAIGEIIFFRLFGRHSEENDRYSFSQYEGFKNNKWFENVNPRVFPLITELLHKTLSCSTKKRYQKAEQLALQLDKIIELSNPKEPFLKSSLPNVSGFFTGRDSEIEEIHKRLQENNILFLSGIGGIGKSELAKHYAKKHEREYDAIIFAPFLHDIQTMITNDSYVQIHNFFQYPEEKTNEYFERKMKELARLSNERTLIIVDNFDTTKDENLSKLLSLNCKMLITTRRDFSDVYSQFYLGELANPVEVFNEHYKKPLSDDERKCVNEIIEIVCGHTMTVELLAKQMMAGRVKPEKMLEKLKSGGISESGKEKVSHANEHGKISRENTYDHIQALFDLSDLGEAEKYVLANLSLIPHTGIPAELFKDWCEIEDFDTINKLAIEGWIRWDKGKDYISIHPVIHEIELSHLSTPKKTWRKIMKSILAFIDEDGWAECPYVKKQQFAEIFRFMLECIFKKQCSSKLTAKFIRNVAECIDVYGHFLEFEKYYRHVINIQTERSGEVHNNTALAIMSLSDYYMSLGRLTDAEELCQKALLIWEDVYGTESKSYIKAITNLASIKKEQHDYPLAEKLMKQALSFYEVSNGTNSKKYLHCLDLLGDIYLSAANYEAALECLHTCLNKKLEKWGSDSISADSTRFSLSVCYRRMENYERSIYYGKIAYKNRRIRRGESHHSLAIVCSALGFSYLLNGNIEEAKPLLFHALSLRQKMYGDLHRRTAESYLRMGLLYEKEADIVMAVSCVEKAVDIRTTLLGKAHPDTTEAINILENIKNGGRLNE